MKLILGIDPGKTGAIAVLDADDPTRLLLVEDMPAATGSALGTCIAQLVEDLSPDRIVAAWVEDVHSMPKQGVRSVWTFALGHGAVLGALGALRVPVHFVSPAQWKRDQRVTADKGTSRNRAMELWPREADLFQRVKDDGRAEAALIARHGQGQS